MGTRLIADRRSGRDPRTTPRRAVIGRVADERRRRVDRRRGSERRSTLERRGRPRRSSAPESPAEHVRNALQLLAEATAGGVEPPDRTAVVARLKRALDLLEGRATS